MSDYTPPNSTNIPFSFTNGRYSSPTSTELLFSFAPPEKFGELRAAVNVMASYWEEAYTYTKDCPKYIIGYDTGSVQIIKGRCLYGGIRDLLAYVSASSIVHKSFDLAAETTGVLFSSSTALRSFCQTIPPKDLSAIIGAHLPEDLLASLAGTLFKGTSNLSTFIDTILPVDLGAFLRIPGSSIIDLAGFLDVWHVAYLKASLRIMTYSNLNSSLYSVLPKNLLASLNIISMEQLPALIHGYDLLNLSGYINQVYFKILSASIDGRTDTTSNLSASLRGFGRLYENLGGVLQPYHYEFLNAILNIKHYNSLPSYLFAVRPKELLARIMCWHISDIQTSIVVDPYPWDLTAEINAVGGWRSLIARVYPVLGLSLYRTLVATTTSWGINNLYANIFCEGAKSLSAFLNVIGGSKDLVASITPKVIRLTTMIAISTMSALDLSATINYLCFQTGYKTLSAYINLVYKKDITAYIKGTKTTYNPTLLSASIGYADSFLVVDKLKIGITINPVSYFVEDILRFTINISKGLSFLNAYINGLYQNSDLGAMISPVEVPFYYYEHPLKNRELVIDREYNGVFKSIEIVEMSFKDVVSEYYYSSRGDLVWKEDVLERWILSLKSMLPANELLHLKRRLHKATSVYDLKKFSTVDAAIRFAINYVTEYPQESLSAYLNPKGYYTDIKGVITPKYIQTANVNLRSSIQPVNYTIIFSYDDKISKI